MLFGGAGGSGGVAWRCRFCRLCSRLITPLPPAGVRRILRASPPAAGPLKVTGTRDLWFCRLCCIGSAWNRLGVTFCEPGNALKNSAGTSDLQVDLLGLPSSILSDLGFNFRGLQTSFFDTNHTLDNVLSMHSFNVIIGINFGGFSVFQGTSRT